MYSPYLQDYIAELSNLAEVDAQTVDFLYRSAGSFITIFAKAINSAVEPEEDLFKISISLLMLDSGIAELSNTPNIASLHYLVAMGFEQSGELLSRLSWTQNLYLDFHPLDNDHWYRLALSLLHYLAGGHRVQALGILRHLERLAQNNESSEFAQEYRSLNWAFNRIYLGIEESYTRNIRELGILWEQRLFSTDEPLEAQSKRLHRLVRTIRERRETALADLGLDNEAEWLVSRGISGATSQKFWSDYLQSLRFRQITTFTNEQKGPEPGFDTWLHLNHDLLVVLPTGSGKTLIGELKTALTLSVGKHAIWILPTRALVRQVKRDLNRAFSKLPVRVEELPTTEDFNPLFTDPIKQLRYIAVTTPERLEALIRANPNAVDKVGLVILDEAQILMSGRRGTTTEFVLHKIREQLNECSFVLMTAFPDTKETLQKFLRELSNHPDEIDLLSSDIRPTRRLYGVITSDTDSRPVVAIYPPGIQQPDGTTIAPYIIRPTQVRISAEASGLERSRKFVQIVTPTRIRSALFVERKSSTEKQAKKIAKAVKNLISLPIEDIARLKIELGRDSITEFTAQHSVAPHHAGLTPLELNLVEKWMRDGLISTIVATPTLAQGVNLPFDLAVVSFTERYNVLTKERESLTETEIQNMLGRAGRAGYVSDGICLLVLRNDNEAPPRRTLDKARRYFFSVSTTQPQMGLLQLARTGIRAKIHESTWPLELGDTTLGEAQTLVSFVLDATGQNEDVAAAIRSKILAFPSAQQFSDQILENTIQIFSQLSQNIMALIANEEDELQALLLNAVKRTGMPIQVLKYFFSALKAEPDLYKLNLQDQMAWADKTIKAALELMHERKWCSELLMGMNVDALFNAIIKWRSGEPINNIEISWHFKQKPDDNRRAIGDFLNHRLSQLAQLWGALYICAEILSVTSQQGSPSIQRMQTFVREGVSSVLEAAWLQSIGGLDRVLAHRLAEVVPFVEDSKLRNNIRSQLLAWNKSNDLIPETLNETENNALRGILVELFG